MTTITTPRGVRNNNPGNIDYTRETNGSAKSASSKAPMVVSLSSISLRTAFEPWASC